MKRLLLASSLLALALAACGGSGPVRAPCPEGQICFETGNGPDPLALDPHKTQGTWESRILRDMLIGLTTVMLPMLATGKRLNRTEGLLLFACYGVYLAVMWPK